MITLKQYLTRLMLVGALLVLFSPQVLHAESYGEGTYGSCAYSQNCTPATAAEQTQVTSPSGLKVAINLVNGQVIPSDGYTIIVTPLNTQDKSIKQVDFYLDGVLVHTETPDKTGTVYWLWNPGQYPGTHIKIVVTGSDGSIITQEYDVTVGPKNQPAPAANTTKPTETNTAQPTGAAAILKSIADGAREIIHALPRQVVYSFPYFLLALLAINILLLLLQTKREVSEYRTLQRLLARARAVNEARKTFMQLASHYLRTPLTLVQGGIDLLQASNLVTSNIVDLSAVSKRLHDKIELLITQIEAALESPVEAQALSTGTIQAGHFWRRPSLFLPILLIGGMVLLFDYLMVYAGSFNITQINVAAQAIGFIILVLITYQIFRRTQLRRRDTHEMQHLVDEEMAANQARDNLITSTTTALNEEVKSLDDLLPKLGGSAATNFLHEGQQRFHDILSKFTIAALLRSGRSNQPFVPVTLNEVVARATSGIQARATQRGIAIQVLNDATFAVQSPTLLTYVLVSVLDNAIAYSPDNGTIEVNANLTSNGPAITVTDHGAGISPEKLSVLFQPFFKAEGAEVVTHEGMGFSLYLDKLILTYLGGTISIESKPGETNAIIRLPEAVDS